MGERTPHLDATVRGALVGLSASHSRGHVVRAILEGVAFSLKETFAILEEMEVSIEKGRLGGGGARSRLWRQIQADIYAREVEVVEAEEGAAYGAALLAGVGAGIWESVDTACDQSVRPAERTRPNSADVETLRARYAVYRRLYPAIKQILAPFPFWE